jgi:hypothetical protein
MVVTIAQAIVLRRIEERSGRIGRHVAACGECHESPRSPFLSHYCPEGERLVCSLGELYWECDRVGLSDQDVIKYGRQQRQGRRK